MPTRFTGRILAHLAHDSYRPALVADIERQMQIEPDDRRVFEQAVELLESEGRVETGSDEKLRLTSYGDEMEGVIKSLVSLSSSTGYAWQKDVLNEMHFSLSFFSPHMKARSTAK